MTKEAAAKTLQKIIDAAQTTRFTSAPSGGQAGQIISLRFKNRSFRARCLVTVPPGPVVAMLTNRGWACVPSSATRLVDTREIESRKQRSLNPQEAVNPIVFTTDSNWIQAASGSASLEFFIQNISRIYTLLDDDPRVYTREGLPSVLYEGFNLFAQNMGIEIVRTGITEVDGYIWIPMLDYDNPTFQLNALEISSLQTNAIKYGAFLTGEHSFWAITNEHLISIFRPEWASATFGASNKNLISNSNPRATWRLPPNLVFGLSNKAVGMFQPGVVPANQVMAYTNEPNIQDRLPAIVDLRRYS